jgi:spore coat polysaccharide biosynthesis protein SpsF
MAAQRLMPRVVASIEARTGASRLPGKVLKPIAGSPALARMIRRVKAAKRLDGIVVATTDRPADEAVAALARCEGVAVFRGSEDDVLDRVLRAQQAMGADVIVELCGDCPLIDPAVIDRAVAFYAEGSADLVTTTHPQSYPQGMDVEVFALAALAEVAANVHDPAVREHVSLYFYQHPERYRVANLDAPPGEHAPATRLLLDYPADLAALDAIWRAVTAAHGDGFTTADVLSLLQARPDLAAINAMHAETV